MMRWLILGLLVYCADVFAAPVERWPAQQLQVGAYNVTVTSYEDEALMLEDSCERFVRVEVKQRWREVDNRKICKATGSGAKVVLVGLQPQVFIQKEGGNAAGWGLFRYLPEKQKMDFYEFNAREINVAGSDADGVKLEVAYAVHDFPGGYKPDKEEEWYWRADEEAPERTD